MNLPEAIADGAAAGTSGLVSRALGDAYDGLKKCVRWIVRKPGVAAAPSDRAENHRESRYSTTVLDSRGVIVGPDAFMFVSDQPTSPYGSHHHPEVVAPPCEEIPMPAPDHRMRSSAMDAADASEPTRVILIDGCSGAQVGDHNEQYSTYWIDSAKLSVDSPKNLAERLFAEDLPVAADIFDLADPPDLDRDVEASSGRQSGEVRTGKRGETLVVVRNSSGIQVGNHNTQHNEFTFTMHDIRVRADQLEASSARSQAIEQLRRDPRNREAARRLAQDVARAADAQARQAITARVETAERQLTDSATNRSGIQVSGQSNRTRARCKIKIAESGTRGLEREILSQAADASARAVRNAKRAKTYAATRGSSRGIGDLDGAHSLSREQQDLRAVQDDVFRRRNDFEQTPPSRPAPGVDQFGF